MNRTLAGRALAVIVLMAPMSMRAQSANAAAGWVALAFTPIGALPPIPSVGEPPTKVTEVGMEARYGSWRPAGATDRLHSMGLGLVMRHGTTRSTLELGYSRSFCSGCNGAWLVGGDVDVPIIEPSATDGQMLRVTLNPALGYFHPEDGGDWAFAGAVNMPVSLPIRAGDRTQVIPFVAPGAGYGRISDGLGATSGARGMVSGGVTLTRLNSPVKWTASFSRIIYDQARTVFGIGFSTR